MNFTFDVEIIVKLFLSVFIGLVLGRERKRNDKSGGSRTMAIVCLSACLIAVLTLKMEVLQPTMMNFTRLMAYGIASIGFLGSGVIIQNKNHVEGLTSASSIWGLVPIGYCIGLGFYQIGLITALLIYLVLESKYWKRGIIK